MQMVIAGTGTDNRYKRFIKQAVADSNYMERIIVPGHVSWQTMAALYRRSEMCILATEIEACPNIAIEAMASGCAIISGDKPPLPEMFNGCALEFKARDVDGIVAGMVAYVNDEGLRTAKKQLAAQHAKIFSWEQCAVETYRVLTEW
jgi:glycosyltransferase involved in cell wall biosynthesis